jgi:hypothetical protein
MGKYLKDVGQRDLGVWLQNKRASYPEKNPLKLGWFKRFYKNCTKSEQTQAETYDATTTQKDVGKFTYEIITWDKTGFGYPTAKTNQPI